MNLNEFEQCAGRLLSAGMVALLVAGTLAAPIISGVQRAWGIGETETYGPQLELDTATEPSPFDESRADAGEDDSASPAGSNDDEIAQSIALLVGELDQKLATLETQRLKLAESVARFRVEHVTGEEVLLGPNGLVEQLTVLEQGRLSALKLLEAVQREQARGEGYGVLSLFSGAQSVTDAEMRQEMLQRIAIFEKARVARLLEDRKLLNARATCDAVVASERRRSVGEAAKAVNAAAYDVEHTCSEIRQCAKNLQHLLSGVEAPASVDPGVVNDASAHVGEALRIVTQAESEAGAWYDALDAIGGADGALSFGIGNDFALSKDAFVEKWGGAIDAFFESISLDASDMPLVGYGVTMARCAYEYKVDPRLCAAVSIVESGGGRQCIRPFNAWGWGAADSDPYGLAAKWSSWEEAIEAWHAGMAGSTSGLATAGCVSELGSIYCSDPSWGASVIGHMERIAELADGS